MEKLKSAAEAASRLMAIAAGCCLMGMVGITTLNIILRRPPFHSPLTGAHELSAFLGALLIGLALPLTQLRKGNISVEILRAYLSEPVAAALERVLALVCGGLSIVIFWRLIVYGLDLRERDEVSMTLAIPFWPALVAIGICFAVLSLVFIVQAAMPADRTPADRTPA
jgi:TRAP-type C4-dicarboxylate transport system permease small subunit